jgi:hypothetical protein
MPNIDNKTGIFYGVISQRSLSDEALDDIFFSSHSTDLYYEEWREDVATAIKNALRDLAYESDIEDIAAYAQDNARYDSDEINPEYDDGEYHIIKCLDSDLMILKSPYVTLAFPCSPCVPAAGDLNTATPRRTTLTEVDYDQITSVSQINCTIHPHYGDDRFRLTYCLGSTWFDNDIAPYPYATLHSDGTLSAWIFPNTTPHTNDYEECSTC